MKALLYIQRIKDLLSDIEKRGGNPIFILDLEHRLVNQLKSHAFEKLKSVDAENLNALQQFVDDLLSRDIFVSRIRYCIVKLKEFSLPEDSYFEFIAKAIDLHILNPKRRSYHVPKSASSIENWLVVEIAKCFQPWYRPEDLFLYDFSQERQLIFPDKTQRRWIISNLGRYLAELSSFEAVTFLCALEIVMTLDLHQNSFISVNTLRHLLDLKDGEDLLHNRKLIFPYSLRIFGILQGFYEGPLEVSDFGEQVLSYIDKNFNNLKSVILILLESEATGFNYEPNSNFDELIGSAAESNLLTDAQKNSIRKAIELHKIGNELDSLRILYPLIEGTLDSALHILQISPSGLRGIRNKADKLVKDGILSLEMSVTGEIISSSRNKVVHGNVLEEDNEIFHPLFVMSITYFQRLLMQLNHIQVS